MNWLHQGTDFYVHVCNVIVKLPFKTMKFSSFMESVVNQREDYTLWDRFHAFLHNFVKKNVAK